MGKTFVFLAIMLGGNILVNILIQFFVGNGVHIILSAVGGIIVASIALSFV